MEKHNPDQITGGPWYNTSICKKLHGTVFEEYIRNSRTDRYNLMCFIDAHEKHQPSYVDDISSGGGNELQQNSTTDALVSLSATINFIDCCLKILEQNILERSNIYFETMECMFQKTPIKLPEPLS